MLCFLHFIYWYDNCFSFPFFLVWIFCSLHVTIFEHCCHFPLTIRIIAAVINPRIYVRLEFCCVMVAIIVHQFDSCWSALTMLITPAGICDKGRNPVGVQTDDLHTDIWTDKVTLSSCGDIKLYLLVLYFFTVSTLLSKSLPGSALQCKLFDFPCSLAIELLSIASPES